MFEDLVRVSDRMAGTGEQAYIAICHHPNNQRHTNERVNPAAIFLPNVHMSSLTGHPHIVS